MIPEKLLTRNYHSVLDQQLRAYYVYTPKGYDPQAAQSWPLLLFLHGDGERGNGNDELPYVLKHGPLYEAWVHKSDLPFVMVSPQLPMFGRDRRLAHLQNRSLLELSHDGRAPQREPAALSERPIRRKPSVEHEQKLAPLLPQGWDCVEQDLIQILHDVRSDFRIDHSRVYLSGLSYGGFGTWHLGAQHPHLFAAIAPVCAWLHPQYVASLANAQLPIWLYAGGRDSVITIDNFYLGMELLRQKGHKHARFTVHEDMEHDVWRRVYQSSELYSWLLSHRNHNR